MNWRDYQARQRVVELGAQFLSYIDEGEGEPVVLIHGIPTWGYLWHPVLNALTASHRVLIPDLLGFGFSDRRDNFNRGIDRQAEWLADWLEQIGVSEAHIVGHDIGGGVALRLATLWPERVRSLCVLNTVCYDSWPIEAMLQLGHPESVRKLSASTVQTLLRQALKQGLATSPDSEVLDGLLAPYRTETGKKSLIRCASALNTNLTTEITFRLPRIAVPTLILWGIDDVFQLFKYGERLADDIPGSQFVRIENARHFVMLDQPEQVTNSLLSFLKGRPVDPEFQ